MEKHLVLKAKETEMKKLTKKPTKAQKKPKKTVPDRNQMLVDLCVDIFAHEELDMEVTINGNGTNCCEAFNVASEILSILGVKRNSLLKAIKARVDQIEGDLGGEDCGDECEIEDDGYDVVNYEGEGDDQCGDECVEEDEDSEDDEW